MPDDKVPDPWAKPSPYHKQELDNLGALHKALAAHIQFQERLERGRAYLQPFRIAAAQRPDGRLQSRHTVVAVEPASVQRERARVVVWLLQAFGPIWDEAQTALDLPPHYVAGALEVALHGGWGDWDAPPPARREGESVRPRDAAEYLRTTMRSHYLGWEPPAPPPPEAFEVYEDYWAALEPWSRHSWERREPIDPYRRAHPGKRQEGRPRGGTSAEGYLHRVRLYNLWRVYPTRYRKRPDLWRGRGDIISWNRFLTVVNEKLHGYYVVEDTLRKATEMAIDWAAPAAGVPDDPAAFVGSNPGPDPGT